MVTDSAEKAQEESRNECKSRTSSTKEIPRWNGVANISCPRLNELFCCQKVAHSVFFYILVFLFLLVFVYILRKLVSLPSGLVKYNSRKPNNNASTATTVRNHSNDALPKRLPTKWPKIDKITDHLAAHLPESAAVTTSNDKKSRIYDGLGESEQQIYGQSGFLNNNPTPSIRGSTPNHVEDILQDSYQDYGDGNDKESVYKSLFNKMPETTTSMTKSSSRDASGSFGSERSEWSSQTYPENIALEKTRSGSSVLNYPENSGFEGTRNEWPAWDYSDNSGFKRTDLNQGYHRNTEPGNLQSYSPGRNFPGYSGFDMAKESSARLQQTSDSDLRSRVTTPITSSGTYSKWGFASSPWVKWGSNWPAGSGFGWYRTGDHNTKNLYESHSSSPRNRLYYDEASGKWAYSANDRDEYGYNSNPTGQMGDKSNPGYPSYSKTVGTNYWNPYYSYGGMNQSEDWSNFNFLNGQNNGKSAKASSSKDYFGSFGPSATTNNYKGVNQQYKANTEGVEEEKDERIHRWPFEEGNTEEPVDYTSRASQPHNLRKPTRTQRQKSKNRLNSKDRKSTMIKAKRNPRRGKKRQNRKKQEHAFHAWKKRKPGVRKIQGSKLSKKSKIPHHGVLGIHSKRRTVKHWHVKWQFNSKWKVKTKVKGKTSQLSDKVSRLKTRLDNKRRLTKTAVAKNRHKTSGKRLPGYVSYNKFTERHQISDLLVGNWRRKVHNVRQCKKLTHFKTNGKVQLSRQHLHRKHKYEYTVMSCRYINDRNNEEEGSDDTADKTNKASNSGNQICRKFWFITTGRITLRKASEHHNEKTYTLTLCKKGSDARGGIVTTVKTPGNNDDKTIVRDDDNEESYKHKNTANNDDKDDQNLNDDVDSDDTNTDKDTEKENSDRNNDNDDTENDSTDKNKANNYDGDLDSDDKTDANKKTGNDSDNNNDFDDDDDDIDSNDSGKAKSHTRKKLSDEKNFDDDDDFDKDIDNDDENTNTNKETENDGTTSTVIAEADSGDGRSNTHNNVHDDEGIDSDTDLDDENDDDLDNGGDNIDADNKHSPQRNNKSSAKKGKTKKPKTNKNKIQARKKSKTSINKSFLPKPNHKRAKESKKVKKHHKHKTASKKGATNDNSNEYERLLKRLTKNNGRTDNYNALAKLVAAISQKNSNSQKTAKRFKNKKSRKHERNKKKKNRKVNLNEKQALLFKTPGIQNTNDIKNFLQNLLTNSNNVQSHLQVMRKHKESKQQKSTKSAKRKQKTKTALVKPASQVDMKDLLKELLPSVLSRYTNIATAAPRPTIQSTMATTPASEHNIPIQNLLNTLRTKSDATENVNTVQEGGLLPSNKPANILNAQNTIDASKTNPELALPKAQQMIQPNVSESALLNFGEQLPGLTPKPDNSLRSAIPTAIPQQNYQISRPPSQLSLPLTPSTYATQERNSIVVPTAQRLANQPVYGYSGYSSSKNNPYSYKTQLSTNVLCFGDSLTSGFYNHGRGKHPYSIRLDQLLNANGKHRYKIVTRGVVGEMAHGSMTKRLPKVLNEGTHFDWVIILGGTNDVAHVKNFGDDEDFTKQLISVWSPKIVNDIEKLHETARRYGSRTVLMTIPETAYELWPEFQSIRNMRLSVNAALRKYATQVRDTTVLCDLAYKLPRSSLSKEMQKFYWNDHIHLNPVGYNKMAEVIAQCIRPYLTQ